MTLLACAWGVYMGECTGIYLDPGCSLVRARGETLYAGGGDREHDDVHVDGSYLENAHVLTCPWAWHGHAERHAHICFPCRQLAQVAKVIKSRDVLGAERDGFFVEIGGFDTHSKFFDTLSSKFTEINDALESFVAEMKAQGVWDDVVVIQVSP